MTYEDLQIQHDNLNIIEMDLSNIQGLKGLYIDGNIAVDKKLSSNEKFCILAEELGHHYTAVGNILDQSNISNRKQEHAGRLWAYDHLIGLSGIIQGYRARCQNRHELAECLGVTEEFLLEALECDREKYGITAEIDGYVIMFEPCLAVIEKFN